MVLGGLIYVPGGRLASGEMTNVLEVYNPYQDTWSRKAPLPEAVSGYALVAFEGGLYLFGGWDGNKALADVYAYDPGLDQWEARADLPRPKHSLGQQWLTGENTRHGRV